VNDIIIAPFSNSAIRDWPARNYAALISLLVDQGHEGTIRVVGTRNQWIGACEIVRSVPPEKVVNECGRMAWPEVMVALRQAACVVANNSGISHLAGHFETPTVCVFGGSHQRMEWRPLGRSVILLSRAIGCSPCQLDHHGISPYGKACLSQIAPETVADAVATAMARDERRTTADRHATGVSWA
jgi:ADP-heptose:LPS heptosyltransferase